MNFRESIYVMNLNLANKLCNEFSYVSSPRCIYIVNYKLISW